MIDLKTRLASAAEAWTLACAAREGTPVPLSRLSKRVMDDGKFFENLETMRRGPSTDTLEKFARFLTHPANWPDGRVAEEALALGHVTGVSAVPDGASRCEIDEFAPPVGRLSA